MLYNLRNMIYVIVGPTGGGKTKTAIELADYLNCPIINGDAFQIYKDMNIGTAKISQDDPNYKKHYLLDICSPEESYSVKRYQEDFRKVIDTLLKDNKDIVICGGTGLYIKAALYDYDFSTEDEDDSSDLENLTNEQLFEMLKKLDYESSFVIHPNNRKRMIRAINIALKHQITKSENEKRQEHKLLYSNVVFYMISPNREELYERINQRVDIMFDEGLVEEVKGLLNKYNLSLTSKAAIGYKEVISYLNKEISLDECKELIKKRSRNYAKRQVTFFKNQLDVKVFTSGEEVIKAIKE